MIRNDYRRIEQHATALLQVAGLPALDRNGAEFGRLCRRLLQALFNWASSQGFVPEGYNPAKGLTNKKLARKQMQARRPFTDEE